MPQTQPLLVRLPKGADLLNALNAACQARGITKAAVQVIGALERATLGYYLQDERRYISYDLPEHCEVLCGAGNVSLKDGEAFVHLHLTLSKSDGSCLGGHAMEGCPIFAAEALLLPLPGADLVRGFDEPTGLFLWQVQAG
jgi:predicted DNA-binding protein with PD1-like motif